MSRTFWDRLHGFTPIVCRLLARHPHGPPLSSLEIAQRSGLSVFLVDSLSELNTWDDVPVRVMRAFIRACHMDFEDNKHMRRIEAYLRALKSGKISRKFAYLKRSPDYETYYLPLRAKYDESRRT